MNRYPILTGLTPAIITAVVIAVANLLRAFGIAEVTKEQVDSINALGSLLLLILGAGGIKYGQDRATPVDEPHIPTGTLVTVTGVTPEGEADPVVEV